MARLERKILSRSANARGGNRLKPEIILETSRLILRKLQASDAPILAQLWSDSEVTRYEGGPREYVRIQQMMRDEARAGQPDPFDMWALVEKATEEVVGHCGLIQEEVDGRKELEVTYTLVKHAWGNGYATEIARALRDYAVTTLNQRRLIALIHPENNASEKVAREIGMELENEIVRPSGQVRRVYVWENK